MTSRKRLHDTIMETSARAPLVEVLGMAADELADSAKGMIRPDEDVYIVGTGYDFTEFTARIADAFEPCTIGLACLWTERCGAQLPGADDAFSLPQEFVEPIGDAEKPTLIVSTSVLADKTEMLRILMRVVPTVDPGCMIFTIGMMASDAEAQLTAFLHRHFPDRFRFECRERVRIDLRTIRDEVAERLDDREVKNIPIMSEWLLSRRFGPRPKNEHTPGFGLGSDDA